VTVEGIVFSTIFIIHSSFFILHYSMFTRADLDHLCMLTALELTDVEKDVLLPQMATILAFVGQLDSCVLDDDLLLEEGLGESAQSLSAEQNRWPELLANIKHAMINHMPQLKTSLAKN
jgi:hypothetical protein